jgi:hypothetical protein
MSPSGARLARRTGRKAMARVRRAFSEWKRKRCARSAAKKRRCRSSRHKDGPYTAANVSSSGGRSALLARRARPHSPSQPARSKRLPQIASRFSLTTVSAPNSTERWGLSRSAEAFFNLSFRSMLPASGLRARFRGTRPQIVRPPAAFRCLREGKSASWGIAGPRESSERGIGPQSAARPFPRPP